MTKHATPHDEGDASDWFRAGNLFEQGSGVDKDEARAASLFAKACNSGHIEGCARLGTLFEQGRGVAKDETRAAELYVKACDGNHAVSCFQAGVLIEHGRGVSRDDDTRPMALYKRACDLGEPRGCVHVYTDACDGFDASSCLRLGILFEQGNGVSQDRARASELYAKACLRGDASGCALSALQKHYAAMLSGLATSLLVPCGEPAPAGAVRTTTNQIRAYAGAPRLEDSDLNVALEPSEVISPIFAQLANAAGSAKNEYARKLLDAPATLVIHIYGGVLPDQTERQRARSTSDSGTFTPGSARVGQVRFDSNAKAICADQVTVKNSEVSVPSGSNWFDSAREQLRDKIRKSF